MNGDLPSMAAVNTEDDSGITLGSKDTEKSNNNKKKHDATGSDDDDDDENEIEIPQFAPAAKKRRFNFIYTGSEAMVRVAKAINESRRTGRPLNTDIFVPPTTPDLLHELSLRELSTERLEMIMTMNAIVRECELISAEGAPILRSNMSDLRRLLRIYDDYALTNVSRGAKIDERHRLALFITRMKIANALAILQKSYKGGANDDAWIKDYYWIEAEKITNIQLARWMHANRACHPLMLVVEDTLPRTHPEYIVGHLMQHCTLECFWQSLLKFAASWPSLEMSGYVVRLFDEMRTRAAFFMSYRELASVDMEGTVEEPGVHVFSLRKQIDKARTKILGLNLNLFGLMDMNNPHEDVRAAAQQTTLLDNVDLVRFNDNYVHVNLDFAEECDRLFHSMQFDLRRVAGLRHSDLIEIDEETHCLACANAAKASAANVTLFEALVDEQVKGTFRTQISEEFRSMVFEFYQQPNEVEAFRTYHGFEVITAQNCISQQRPRDYKVLESRFTLAHSDVVWQNLRGDFDEPAYNLMCIITLSYYMQQALRGARITTYFIDLCKSGGGVNPHLHIDERADQPRNTSADMHVSMTTTGTFLFRNKLVNQQGMLCDRKEIEYKHPLIVRSLNSVGVLYNDHLHKCDNFAHAFLMWLHVMCTDRYIEGQLSTGAFLHQLYARLFPEREAQIRKLAEDAERRLRKYNPLAKFVDPAIDEAKASLASRNVSQF